MNGLNVIKAIVTTNCEDDPYLRVKVKNEDIWAGESSLIFSFGNLYLEVDDYVLVDVEDMYSPVIIAKLYTKDSIESSVIEDFKNGEGVKALLFHAKNEGNYVGAYIERGAFILKSRRERIYHSLVIDDSGINISTSEDNGDRKSTLKWDFQNFIVEVYKGLKFSVGEGDKINFTNNKGSSITYEGDTVELKNSSGSIVKVEGSSAVVSGLSSVEVKGSATVEITAANVSIKGTTNINNHLVVA